MVEAASASDREDGWEASSDPDLMRAIGDRQMGAFGIVSGYLKLRPKTMRNMAVSWEVDPRADRPSSQLLVLSP